MGWRLFALVTAASIACGGAAKFHHNEALRYPGRHVEVELPMNWDAIGAIGETVGAIAVVISLIYVAVQMRNNAKALRADAYWNAVVVFGQANLDGAKNAEFSALVARAMKPEAMADEFTEGEMSS